MLQQSAPWSEAQDRLADAVAKVGKASAQTLDVIDHAIEPLLPYIDDGFLRRDEVENRIYDEAIDSELSEYGAAAIDDRIRSALEASPRRSGSGAPAPLSFINLAAWEGVQAPPREWVAHDRIPLRAVTLLAGEGGVGKTIIALQLAHAQARGADWLGSILEPGPAMYLSAEDDADELHRRMDAINQHFGTTFADLRSLHLRSLVGTDAVLGKPDRAGVIQPTDLFLQLELSARAIQPRLIVLDTLADVFAGNENDRSQTRQFVGLLRRLALAANAGVLALSHPSLSGIASGSGLSGSTGWHNSVRSRLYFTAAKTEQGAEPDKDLRQLQVMKNNYGPAGETVALRWRSGVFVPDGGAVSLERLAAEANIDRAVLAAFDRLENEGRQPAPLHAATVLAGMPETKAYSKDVLRTAIERGLKAGKIEVRESGPPSTRRKHIYRAYEARQ